MTLRHLQIFIAVCKYKSTVETSKQLHIAQPSISFAIKEIENHYGIKLFDRISRKLILTEDGKFFLFQANDIINKVNNLESSLKNSDSTKIIKLGCSSSIATFLLPTILKTFKNENINSKINITIRDSKTLKDLILENNLDLALIETPIYDQNIVLNNFYEDSLILYLSKNNTLVNKDKIHLKDLIDKNLILREKHSAVRTLIDSLFISNSIDLNIENDSTSTQAILSLIDNDLGLSILPSLWKDYIKNYPNITTRNIYDLNINRKYSIIYHKNKYLSKNIQTLINICTNINCEK